MLFKVQTLPFHLKGEMATQRKTTLWLCDFDVLLDIPII